MGVLLGNLNFRVEVHSHTPSPQSPRGISRDYEDAIQMIESGESGKLFQSYEHLRGYLINQPTMMGYQDATEHKLRSHGYIHNPTYPLSGYPGSYNPRRTPSWTDRILWKGFRAHHLEHDALLDITVSSHAPIFAVWDMEM
eukprot:NODE_1190_length_476_cov_10.896848_g1180_i0.p1 GENE.NODE_1190_length_476_cov_10.896848_g1180_i0~~NODE_1190_length_476_cov_10.896848_g1180_i0.p1  ORF type:complete len:141 (+),score=20.00 NODE_1190_length_476_cov_10.896848_g1180_i0:3-425(+)